MNSIDPDSSVYYHHGDPDDPFVEDHQRHLSLVRQLEALGNNYARSPSNPPPEPITLQPRCQGYAPTR